VTCAEFARLVENAKRRADGKWWDARCPAHADKRASLSFAAGDYALVVECHAGCTREQIAAAVGLRAADFSHRANGAPKDRPRIVVTYTYCDERGAALYDVVRLDPKDFRCRRADGTWSMAGVRRVPYRLHELAKAPRVYIPEGEKDVDALRVVGLVATCNEGGAGKWREEHTRALVEAAVQEVVVLRDNDPAGATHQSGVATACAAAGLRVKRLDLPGLPPKSDISDYIAAQRAAGRTDDEIRAGLVALADSAPVFTPETATIDSTPAAESPEHWDPPVSIEAPVTPAPFPLAAFPADLARLATSVVKTHQVPLELFAPMLLAVVAAAAARRVEVAVGSTHREPLNLYVAIASDSGEKKGPALREAKAPLEAIEVELQQEMAPEIAAARERRHIEEARLKHLREVAAKKDDMTSKADAETLARNLTAVPAMPQLVVGNITPEKLEIVLSEQGGAVAMMSEEAGAAFEIAAGRYADGAEQLDTLLCCYDGGRLLTDRVQRGHVAVTKPALTILQTPQPSILERFRDHAAFEDRGLLARFAFIVAPSLAGTRTYRDVPIDRDARAAYHHVVRTISALPRPVKPEDIATLHLDRAALNVWAAFHDEIERELGEGGRLHHVRAWGAKHAGRVARIAGLLHLVTTPAGDPSAVPISVKTIEDAVTIGHWLVGHALAAYELISDPPDVALARRLRRWIIRHGHRAFTVRDAHRAHPKVKPDDLRNGLRVLEDRGYIRRKPAPERDGKPGQKPSPAWAVSPMVVDARHN
jgi:hypothetical protein